MVERKLRPAPSTLHLLPSRKPAKSGHASASKLFVLDTNVLMHDPTALFKFEEHDVFLPMMVLPLASAHNYLGITASQKGWQEAAEKEMLEAIASNPNYADAHFNLAVVYSTSQPPAKELARRHYEKALALGAPPDPTLDKLLGR